MIYYLLNLPLTSAVTIGRPWILEILPHNNSLQLHMSLQKQVLSSERTIVILCLDSKAYNHYHAVQDFGSQPYILFQSFPETVQLLLVIAIPAPLDSLIINLKDSKVARYIRCFWFLVMCV